MSGDPSQKEKNEPVDWCVTAGNDKQVCFWDSAFNVVKKWKMPSTVNTLCWCPEINVLYYGTEHSSKIKAWRITDTLKVRESEEPFEPVKMLELKTGHTKAVQAVHWMSPLQCIATASLDATVKIFDLVQMQKTYDLKGHTKGLTCLEYCPGPQILLSGGFDNVISMWDPGAGIRSHALRGHECSIAGIKAVPDTEHEFMSVDLHSVVKLWDIRRLACVQSFHATDLQAEKSGEIEPLEPRALCMLSRDRFVISGRRMVSFERDASQPQLTDDSPIMAMVFSTRKFEIATSVKNSIRIWSALTGDLLTVHNNVIGGNITAMSLGLGERRCFVGADDGSISVINFACGAPLKQLTPHQFEVTEIQCIPTKVLTLSVGDKLIVVHDDTNPNRAAILKTIDISGAGTVLRMSHDGDKLVCGGNEDGHVFWFALDFAKQVSNTTKSAVRHQAPVSCIKYFQTAPLMCTADSESSIIFWSMQPLRSFEFFTKLEVDLVKRKEEVASQGSPSSTTSQQSGAGGAVSITSLAIAYPNEDMLILGSETGNLVCIDISTIVEKARKQKEDILKRKESGEAADVISGRIFDSMEKPCDSPEYVLQPENEWLVERAHRGSIDQIIFCLHKPPIIITLGFDVRVCIWHPITGEALGTLEQGLSEGIAYDRRTTWRFPIDAHEQVALDMEALAAAVVSEAGSESGASGKDSKEGSDDGKADSKKKEDAGSTTGKEGSEKGSQKGSQKLSLIRSESSPGVLGREQSFKLNGIEYPDYSKTGSRLHKPCGTTRQPAKDHKWFAGALGTSTTQLPALAQLNSGLRRTPNVKGQPAVIAAAKRLSDSLGSLDGKPFDSWM
jgi:WD40 repeat protein